MEIHTCSDPAKQLGRDISRRINEHHGDAVCLLSGGSALDVVRYIELSELRKSSIEQSSPYYECRTIFMMGDERWSRESHLNNSLQLQTLYPDHMVTKSLIETIPDEHESLIDFAARIEGAFLKTIAQLSNLKIFMVLGMGADGHTAGIFPLPQGSFQMTYGDDTTYVPVHVEGLTIDSRASFSPSWILGHVDEIFAYVTGGSKQAMLESLINESKELHERPAELIKRHKQASIYTNLAIC